jgi:hypothetical protein
MTKNISQAMPWGEKVPKIDEGKYQVPVKMAVLWSPAMYTAAGKKPTRGFGGRIYFYNAKNETVPVQGQLVVYCFDDTKKNNDHKQPDRRVAFTPEQFTAHHSTTQLGASYSVWVPWDVIGNAQAEITLLPIFTAATGQVLVGPQSLGLLPGEEGGVVENNVEQKVIAPKDLSKEFPAQVGYEGDLAARAPGRRGVEALTIPLTESLAERVAAASHTQEIVPAAEAQGAGQKQASKNELLTTGAKGSPSVEGESIRPNSRPAPERLSHSERIRPRAPATLPLQPNPYPPATEPLPEESPSSHPLKSESGQSN